MSPNARRVYAHTYRCWREFAWQRGLDVFDLRFDNIRAFISEADLAYKTRQSWRIHLLRLLDWLEEADGRGEWYGKQRHRILKFLKFKREQHSRGGSRSQRALNKTEVAQLLDVWAGDDRLVTIHNTALLRLLDADADDRRQRIAF